MCIYNGNAEKGGWGGSHMKGYGNITLSFNKVFNVMTKIRDGGGFYLNGYTNPQLGQNVISVSLWRFCYITDSPPCKLHAYNFMTYLTERGACI